MAARLLVVAFSESLPAGDRFSLDFGDEEEKRSRSLKSQVLKFELPSAESLNMRDRP